MIKILDNIIPKKEQDNIKNILFGRGFPWYYVNDISHTNNEFQTRPGHSHIFYDKGISICYTQLVIKLIKKLKKS
jgi:hypothetical protein